MCTVSFVGTQYQERWTPYWYPVPPVETIDPDEFAKLKREVEELKRQLKIAKQIDELQGNPDCEMGEKVRVISAISDLVGVDLGDLLHPRDSSDYLRLAERMMTT